ncbi:L-lactate dehydrogenase [Pulveribacter suum]|uniref:L-lactate dehydrogenase n=1 Tax=Pulveribacter suum TaxID=2116657 RepID=A0A2P1NN62_9BURK|nr:L-lactate dehydrogenase [Pulveribacter suum]AVP58491.1 L-lactate dehydrogenase [Pulveribacter suum]
MSGLQFPATAQDWRAQARGRLPRFLFDYLDGGAGDERTLAANVQAWGQATLRQRVLVDVSQVDTRTRLAGQDCALPLALAPVGLAGMMARRGEAQALRAASGAQVPFTLSTVGICGLNEVCAAAPAGAPPPWFQLYMLRDRGAVRALLEQAWQAGCRTLVFTVDLPLPGMRQRDVRNGMAHRGARAALLRASQLLARPGWVWDVALRGKPLSFGSLASQVPGGRDLNAFKAWVDAQFDPSVTWQDIDWLRTQWRGRLLLKGLLDVQDARAAAAAGAEGIVVSNHGGRQLDGVAATAEVLPAIARAVGGQLEVLVDGGVRSGTDLFRALALGARGVLIGRPWVWALAAGGEAGVRQLLAAWQRELLLAMTLTGVTRVADIGPEQLDRVSSQIRP